MAYVLIVLGGVSLQSPAPVPLEACEALKVDQPATLCVDVEPACGKGTDNKCLGRADLEEKPAAKKKRTVYRSSRTRTARR